MNKHIRTVCASLSTSALFFVAGCTTLPGNSEPEAISTYVPTPPQVKVAEPEPGRASDLTLRDFFSASTHPLSNHQAARKFLTPETADKWDSAGDTLVLDRIFINSEDNPHDSHAAGEGAGASDAPQHNATDRVTYRVRGNVIGTLSSGGVFTPEYTAYETTYQMKKVDNQWLISDLVDTVLLDRSDFMEAYEPRPIYFVDPQGHALVPDRRWVYLRQQSISSSLLSLLAAGPQEGLRRGVQTFIPPRATVQATRREDGELAVDFAGIADLNSAERELLAAQTVWTLAISDVRGPYRLTADGAALSDVVENPWRINDVSQFDPRVNSASPLRAVVDGEVVEVKGNSAEPVAGWLDGNYVESAAVAPQGDVVAAVVGQGDNPRRLLVGGASHTPQTAYTAKSLTRPTWAVDANSLYTVADGRRLIRINRTGATGEVTHTAVNTDVLRDLDESDPRISVFRVSHDGVRAVLLINGRVYTSVLEQRSEGSTRLGPLTEIGYALGDTAVSADWRNDGTILVGTRANDAPVWSIAMDGSLATQLAARNISAPVVAVAATNQIVYATDARALMQLSGADPEPRYWREVPGMQGRRAVPVLS